MWRESELVPSNGTYLCSMQGNMYRITTLGGRSTPCKGVIKLQRIYIKGSTWLDMRQAQAIWMITRSQGAGIKLKKESKTHEMQLQLGTYKGVPMGKS